MTEEQKQDVEKNILVCIKYLAARCDGANSLDGQGYNGVDADFGHDLAQKDRLTYRQQKAGLKMLKKYKKQLEAGGCILPEKMWEEEEKPSKQLIVGEERITIVFGYAPSHEERDFVKSLLAYRFDGQSKNWSVDRDCLSDVQNRFHDFTVITN